MSEIEEERAILVGLDDLDRLVSPVVGKITCGFEFIRITRVIRSRKTHARPEKFVYRVKRDFGVDDIGVVLRQIQTALHQQAVVKALIVWRHAVLAPQMPFANVCRVIPLFLEGFGDGHLGSR